MTVFMCIQNATWLIYVINYIDNVFLIIQNAGKCTNVNTGLPRLLHIGHFLFQQMAAATLVQNYMPLLWDRPTWYDSVYLACNKKLMGSHLSLQYGINKKLKCKTKNKLASMIGPVPFVRYQNSVVFFSDVLINSTGIVGQKETQILHSCVFKRYKNVYYYYFLDHWISLFLLYRVVAQSGEG